MKEKPILFSTDMVRAILDGRKTQTRRIVKHEISCDTYQIEQNFLDETVYLQYSIDGLFIEPYITCPYGQQGDVLWVRERFCKDFLNRYWYYQQFDFKNRYHYVHDSKRNEEIQFKANDFKPSIHMPKAAARIWLKIESIAVERLQDITEQDAIAEGIIHKSMNDPKVEFQHLWQSINGPDSWAQNPWVWVVKFKVLSTTGKPTNLLTQ